MTEIRARKLVVQAGKVEKLQKLEDVQKMEPPPPPGGRGGVNAVGKGYVERDRQPDAHYLLMLLLHHDC